MAQVAVAEVDGILEYWKDGSIAGLRIKGGGTHDGIHSKGQNDPGCRR